MVRAAQVVTTVVPLDFPLPQANWYQLPSGLWASRAWTPDAYALAKLHAVKTVVRVE